MSVSNKDIEEAKRRVREMQSRANSFVSGSNNAGNLRTSDIEENKNQKKQSVPQKNSNGQKTQGGQASPQENTSANDSESPEKDSQTFIILMLLLILSREKADGKLLLALLYLLM